MKKSKILDRVIIALVICIVLSFSMTVVSFASEDILPSDGVTQGGEAEMPVEEEIADPANGFEAFIETVKVLVSDKLMQTVSAGIDIIVLVILYIFKKASTGNTNTITLGLKKLANANENQSKEFLQFKEAVSERVSDLVSTYAKNSATHDQVREALMISKASLEMMHTVYTHSKTISDATKEQMGLIYTTAVRQIAALEEGDVNNDNKV